MSSLVFEFVDGTQEIVWPNSPRHRELLADGHAPVGSVPESDGISDELQAYLAGAFLGVAAETSFKSLARTPDQIITGTVTRDGNGAATSAPVVWPDGQPGTYTATSVSTAFPGAVDAYTITYGSPVTKTYTQPAVTRDSNGAATSVPAITVS